ncbi:ATP-binding protein [Phenylobacterium sp.]|uniref:sensor histidine kinase n=1 Tax=Phenylobacterium sp. TaxID=1871053 RepID=UPI0035AFE11A
MRAPAIFVIDDDPAELELLGYTLEEAFPGAQVRAESDAAQAQPICEAEAFDCVIVDYNMPGIDGLACAQGLRASFPYLPIVLSTGVGDEMLAAHAVQSGVTDYIPKSRITPESLRRTIEHSIRVTSQSQIIDEQRHELENFAYALAHDFKQPIRQIRTFSTLVAEALHDGRTAGVDQHLAYLNNAARRLADLVDVMSQYTLLHKPPQIGAVDLNQVLGGMRSSLAPYLEERGGQIITSPAPVVLGNEALMAQVLQNLTVNGLKYNESKTPIVIITTEVSHDACVIKVEDNGIGIEQEYFDEIFKPLARLHNNSEYPGSGLGLTLARKALTAQGGAIWCRSEVGIGSEFFVRMPLARPEAQYNL